MSGVRLAQPARARREQAPTTCCHPPLHLPCTRSISTAASFTSPPAWTQNKPGLFRGMLWKDFVADDAMKISYWWVHVPTQGPVAAGIPNPTVQQQPRHCTPLPRPQVVQVCRHQIQ